MPAATESAGATPVEAGATPAQSDEQPTASAAPAEPATGEGDGLKRALDAERAQRRELEKALKSERAQREALETSQLSDQEKAIAKARKDLRRSVPPRGSCCPGRSGRRLRGVA